MLFSNPQLILFSMAASIVATICLALLIFCMIFCLVNPEKVKQLKTTMLILAIMYTVGTAPLLIRSIALQIKLYPYQTNSNMQNKSDF